MPRCGREYWIALALFGICLAAFGRACANGFVSFDDPEYVTDNPRVVGGLTPSNIAWAFTTFHAGNWHPLTWLSLPLDASLFGARPWAFHLTNILFHAAAAALLFLALFRMTGETSPAAIVAALFALHPLRVESVAWVSERKDVLGAFFWMLCLLAYARYARRPGPGRYAPVAAAMVLGLLAKPMLVTLPCVLLLLDCWPLRRLDTNSGGRWRVGCRLCLEKAPLLVLVAAASAVTIIAQKQSEAVNPLTNFPLPARAANAVLSYAIYIGQTFWPTGLAPMYVLSSAAVSTLEVTAAAVLLAAVSVGVVLQASQRRYLAVGWLWYLGTLVPMIGLVQVGSQAHADRYTYVPQVGLFLAVVWALADWARAFDRARLVGTVAVGSIAVLMFLTVVQVGYWHDSVRLWERAVEATSANGLAYNSLGQAYRELGNDRDACLCFLRATEINPDDGSFHLDLAGCLNKIGEKQRAIAAYERAFQLVPGDSKDHNNFGFLLETSRDERRAIEQFREAVRLDSGNALARVNLARVLLRQGHAEEAVRECREALASDPALAVGWHGLGEAYQALDRGPDAVECFQRAIDLLPGAPNLRFSLAAALDRQGQAAAATSQYRELLRTCPECVPALQRTAWLLATHPDARQRNGPQSLELATILCRITDDRPESLDVLAASYAENGRFGQARATAKRALEHAGAARNEKLAAGMRARLQLYERNEPYREQSNGARP